MEYLGLGHTDTPDIVEGTRAEEGGEETTVNPDISTVDPLMNATRILTSERSTSTLMINSGDQSATITLINGGGAVIEGQTSSVRDQTDGSTTRQAGETSTETTTTESLDTKTALPSSSSSKFDDSHCWTMFALIVFLY